MRIFQRFCRRHYLTLLAVIGILFCTILIYCFGSRSFLPNLSAAEQQIIEQSKSLQAILQNPLWLPYKLLTYIAIKIGAAQVSIRFVSAFFTIITVYAFYSIASKWYSQRAAVLTTVLFALSSSTLTFSRIATPAVLLYSWLLYCAVIVWFKTTRCVRLAPFAVLIVSGLLLYVPGSPWFLVLLCLWFWRDIPKIFKHMNAVWISAGAVILLAITMPLLYAFVKDPMLIKSWLLLPPKIDIPQSLRALKDVPAAFFYRSNMTGAYTLGRLPIFDAFSGTMLLLGVYAYRKKLRLERSIIYIFAFAISALLAALNSNQLYLIFCLPFMYLLIGEGLYFLLSEWRNVFPRNPIARFAGTLLMTIAVFGACSYHLNRYFLAWVNTPETRQIYSQPPQQ